MRILDAGLRVGVGLDIVDADLPVGRIDKVIVFIEKKDIQVCLRCADIVAMVEAACNDKVTLC
ncbi:MAG TPA: hypothetical protein VF490_09880 [Chryseosolibacter sp.]